MLLILDDIADYGAIKDYLPPAQPKLKILITSRQYLGSNIKSISQDVSTEDVALDSLLSLTTEQRINYQIETAKKLVKWLGYLPLGLELVGRYLQRHPTINLEQLDAKNLAYLQSVSQLSTTTEKIIMAKINPNDTPFLVINTFDKN